MVVHVIELEPSYRPSEDEEYMCSKHREYFRRKLLAWKEAIKRESSEILQQLKEENWNEPDPSDRVTVEIEIGKELRTKDRLRKLIENIDAALLRIEKGVYGYCEESNEPIGLRRLEARPVARFCIEAQERHERFEKSHNEEVV
ncbi:RNA polymerase-binding transcription factor DksA [Alphaproteobacteria bacterium]